MHILRSVFRNSGLSTAIGVGLRAIVDRSHHDFPDRAATKLPTPRHCREAQPKIGAEIKPVVPPGGGSTRREPLRVPARLVRDGVAPSDAWFGADPGQPVEVVSV